MTNRQKLWHGIIILTAAIVGIAWMVSLNSCAHAPMNCADKVIHALDAHPGAVVWYGMIYDPGGEGHGEWHVQAQDGDEWLTKEYNLLPKLKFTAEKYRGRYKRMK